MAKGLGITLIVIAFFAIAMHSFSHALYMFQYAFMLLTHNLVWILLGIGGLYLFLRRK